MAESNDTQHVNLKGSCLCGAVSYSIDGPVHHIACCHCVQCRKQTGMYYATIKTPNETLTVCGEDHLSHYRASEDATRKFCSRCGSAMFWQGDGSDLTYVLAGSVDGDTGLKIKSQIFCEVKGDYYALTQEGALFPNDD
ncbi:MAG: GFA family protein [Pseudomonadota bacterium]